MASADTSVLQHRRVLESRDPDMTGSFMAAKEFHLDLPAGAARSFDFATSAVYLPNSYLGYIQYGSAATVRVPDGRARDDYFIHLPLRGRAEVLNHAGRVVCRRDHAVISAPSGHVMHAEAGSTRITLSITAAAIAGQAAALLGEAPRQLPAFAAGIDLASPAGRSISRQIRLAIADLDDGPGPPSPIMASAYEQLIITGLLLHQPNSCSAALERRAAQAPSRDVQRAVDYMQGRLGEPITLADIVAASGIPGRTLLQHFKDHRGTSPMRYLRHARLARVREALMRARDGDSVTDIALTWGFNHLGRFSVEYRAQFGESPSQTFKRSRAMQR
ncbi:AraC family transcriptional regulator [Vineibacter terrae]|uniref:AraC family transcriptional regulator n=1 Tax=Vineibacter terrae TaxID=2586908 RepID=UPI002E2F2053|nr:AraC family transcriptional regulator [Vineibacter terrae]HEX2889367.1 AraC family transcriptional regulator [Vineibacter terrae]